MTGYGEWGSEDHHKRECVLAWLPRQKRAKCYCGCGKRTTHMGMANGVVLMCGCGLAVRRWVREQDTRLLTEHILKGDS